MMPPLDADRKLREAAQLWALGEKLPHLATPAEERLIAAFATFLSGVRSDCDVRTATAGLRSLWTAHRWREILDAFSRLDNDAKADRDVRVYAVNAAKILQRTG